jgi:hypothetical protein
VKLQVGQAAELTTCLLEAAVNCFVNRFIAGVATVGAGLCHAGHRSTLDANGFIVAAAVIAIACPTLTQLVQEERGLKC